MVVFIAAIFLAGILLIGPQRVATAMRSLIGYLPGVGIVDRSAPIRILAEPVSLTRQGITVSVNRATLTADQTQIEVGVSGVPLSAYPKSEAVLGCIEPSYLRLPDGTRLEVDAIFPANVNEAVYVMPCIFNTLPGAAPTDWELPLKFIPAPPSGAQIAYVTSGDAYGVFVVAIENASSPKQLSNLGYESLAGWSPDGGLIYYAIPGASGDGFLLRAVEVSTGATRDLFTLEDSSRKAPLPEVSPDGKWMAYRASNNSSVYLKAMDGASPARLFIENPGLATSSIAWEKEGHLLGISVITHEEQGSVMVLLQVDPCEAYVLPGLNGEINGIMIP